MLRRTLYRRTSYIGLVAGLCCGLLGCAFGPDVTLEVFNLRFSPTPAQEGDLITLSFQLTVIAPGSVSLSAMIDGEEYGTQTVNRLFSGTFTWDLGDAGDLIDQIGLGDHTVQILARDPTSDRVANSEQVTFTLVTAEPTG